MRTRTLIPRCRQKRDDLLEKNGDELYPYVLGEVLAGDPKAVPVTYEAVRKAAVKAAASFKPEVTRAE